MPSAAASLARRHPPAPRGCLRPFARRNARERRLGQRLAMGLTPAQAARAEGVAPAEVEVLLAEPGFRELVAGFEELAAKPEAELRQILTRLARFLLLEAAAFGDVRVAFFVLHQERQGRDPARTLAEGVIAPAAAPPAPQHRPGLPRRHRPSPPPARRSTLLIACSSARALPCAPPSSRSTPSTTTPPPRSHRPSPNRLRLSLPPIRTANPSSPGGTGAGKPSP